MRFNNPPPTLVRTSFKDAPARIILNISRISSLASSFANVPSGLRIGLRGQGCWEPCSPDAIPRII